MFSADFRRAVAAEAAGDYAEAARAYALAGEHAKVAEMHLLRAERAPSPEGSLQELRAAVRWADPADADGRAVRRRIARALFTWAKKAGVVSDADKQVVREAAALFAEGRDHAGAGECHELIGDEMAAAEAYQRAGDLEKLEAVLQREEVRRKKAHRVTDAFDEYRMQLAGGERDRALQALRACVDEAGSASAGNAGDLGGYRRMLEQLEGKLLTEGKVSLRAGASETHYVGAFPAIVGREAICHLVLRDAGISRRHCEIARGDGKFLLHDLESKNGTLLGGVPLAPGGAVPLDGAGELGVGEHCGFKFEVRGELLLLDVARGLDRGMAIRLSARPFALLSGAAELRFADGRPRLTVLDQRGVHLNGVHAGGAVQLIRGDLLDVGDQRIEVL